MVVLSGKNLGERQHELNTKVAEVIANKKNFNDIKKEEEMSDVDKFYKIDIASHYKDLDYIIEVLKSGDSLHISRALKCLWIYHDDYNHIFNTQYLHENIFPFMSIKMKKKMLSTISMHIKKENIAADYFIYCKKYGMYNIALKFLNFTSEEFKLNVLKSNINYIDWPTDLPNFVKNSFALAVMCIEMYYHRTNILHDLRYLYAINNEKYLDILEKHKIINIVNPNTSKRLGIRISKDIILKHKNRVLENPLLYVNILNKSMLIKYSSKYEAKEYIIRLIPLCVEDFWQMDFCTVYDYILNLIPINEKFDYIKQLFTNKYPGQPFEMTIYFYKLKYYNLMPIDQRELWALCHINEQKEIIGADNDYIWYKFVNIDRALLEIKKLISLASNNDKRSGIVNILVEASRDQKDLKKVLDYYYERHINETECHKKEFIDKVLSVHNVFEFNKECWEALNKLFYSLDIYTVGRYSDKVFVAVAVICHIIHNIDMPQALIDFVDLDINYSYFSILLTKLSKEKSEVVLQYLLKLFVDKLKPFEQEPYNKKLRKQLKMYVNNILNLLSCFQKDDQCPEIVTKFMNIHSPKPKETKILTVKDIFNYIKTDVTLALDVLGSSDLNIIDDSKIINCTLKKLKVYFYNDVAPAYVNYLDRTINKSSDDYNSQKVINAAVFGIFQLADEHLKISVMEKYQPSEPKIDHTNINRKVLIIQEAICRFVSYSRPPVPLINVIQYIKGDYLRYCLPMFNMYLVNLSPPLVMEFTEYILNAPLSVQKHGLRLAFKCYTSDNLKILVLNTWKKSKNVSLRKIIYKALFDKISEQTNVGDDEKQLKILYEALKSITSDLHQYDDEDLFELISCQRFCIPNIFIDDYLQTVWQVVNKLPKKTNNIERQIKIIRKTEMNMKFVQRDFVRKSIIDEHVHEILEHRRLRPDELYKSEELWQTKWNLIATYIVQYRNEEELQESLALLSLIFSKCLELWNDKYEQSFIFRKFFFNFIKDIEFKIQSIWNNDPKEKCSISIFNHILDMLQKALTLKEIYLIIWNIKLSIYLGISLNIANTELYDGDGNMKPLAREEIISDNIANHIEKFVQELLSKQQFYSVYLPEIARLLKDKLLGLQYTKNLNIILCQSLTNIGLKETHFLSLMLLPLNVPEEMREIHTRILEKIQSFENEEIQSFLHYKFLSAYYYPY